MVVEMEVNIREGTIEEAVGIMDKIPEFAGKTSFSECKKRFKDKFHLILVASIGDELVGFKIGYADGKKEFYTWIGGVLVDFRRRGIAQKLADKQEEILKSKNFKKVKIKTRNKFKEMIYFLLKNNFYFVGFEKKDDVSNYRLLLEKDLFS